MAKMTIKNLEAGISSVKDTENHRKDAPSNVEMRWFFDKTIELANDNALGYKMVEKVGHDDYIIMMGKVKMEFIYEE